MANQEVKNSNESSLTRKAGRMTREEAIARIKDHIEIHRYHERNAVKIFEALDMAIAALEKQIPKKPTGEHYAHMRCPSCNHRIPSGSGSSSRRRDNWCNYCGQKIDWERHGRYKGYGEQDEVD